MKPIYRTLDTIAFALERLWRQRWLVIWALLGLTAATTLALSLPLYSDSVNSTLLASKLNTVPYAFRFRYLGSWKGNIGQADVNSENATINQIFAPDIGLPVEDNIQYVRTSAWRTVRISSSVSPLTSPAAAGSTGSGAQSGTSATKTATPTSTSTPTRTPTATPTATRTPTRTPTVTPTATPNATKSAAGVTGTPGTPAKTAIPTLKPTIAAPINSANGATTGGITANNSAANSGSTVAAASTTPVNLAPTSLGLLEGIGAHITIPEGAWPPDMSKVKPGDPLPVLAPETMLYSMGVQVGDILQMTPSVGSPVKVQIVGMWKATDATDLIWNFYPPKAFDAVLFLPSATLWSTISKLTQPVEEAAWYVTFNGTGVRTADINGLIGRINTGTNAAYQALPGVRNEISPVDNLNQFNAAAQQLTLELAIIILPVAGLVLYFVSLIAGLLVSRQNQEDVTLGSRGLGRRGILGIHMTMWLILAGLALALGMLISPPVVDLVGRTTSFLQFNNPQGSLTVTFTTTAIAAGAITALLAASSGLYAAWQATSKSITSYRVEAARPRQAWWQKIYLDFLLLIPAYYVLYSLTARHGASNTGVTSPFSDPLTFLGPSLFTLGHTLLFIRIWPSILRIFSGILTRGRGIAGLMALRELTRSIGRYRGSLLMMIFTLSLAGFTDSMANTLDRDMRDQINYQVGANLVIVTSADAQTSTGSPDATTGQATTNVTGYNVLPVDDLRTIPGVQNVSRVGHYDMQLMLPKGPVKGTALGIDRDTMAAVTLYRSDFSDQPLADLFNKLAANPTGIIISEKMAIDDNLRVNQLVNYQLYVFSQWRQQTQVPIIGIVKYFPTLDPNATPFIITELDPIFDLATTYLNYDVWMSLAPGADVNAIMTKVQALGFPVVETKDADQLIYEQETAPDRRGVLGFLSIGFIASIFLTLIGNIVQSTASFQAQSFQLGSLRAMGLSGGAVARYLITSQGLAVLSGIAGGTVLGALTTILFLPLLDFGSGLPPYQVKVPWVDLAQVYGFFALILLGVTLMLTLLLGRERLSNVVKLGEGG